ncbi:MAG: Holliday junction branch migration protein RuvA [Eggerthellaceae bacterium]|nr:Holliday junction branch migration protein RuvA [Eggerthellaceae bacterium]
MIAFVRGVVAHKGADFAIVEAGGIGYRMGMSTSALSALPDAGGEAQVFTYLQASDNGLALYGFASQEEKELFEQLIGVTSVGPKMALAALSTFAPAALSSAIMASDVDAIARIPGIGKKKASRIVLELQGTLAKASEEGGSVASGAVAHAVEDLLAMGFTAAESDLAVKGAPEGASEAEILQYALRRLGQ